MIAILHGYLLEGSGSNLWTRSMIQALVRQGQTVHLMCQEPHPEIYDFIGQVFHYDEAGKPHEVLNRETPYAGQCIMHKPYIGEILPVYVWDHYEEYEQVVPMVKLDTSVIERYLSFNANVLTQIIQRYGIRAVHANHAVLMSVVAQRAWEATGVPYAVMPHGSAIEYAVKKDERFMNYAREAFRHAGTIFLIGKEMEQRLLALFPDMPDLPQKMVFLNLGVNTEQFQLIPRNERRTAIRAMLERVNTITGGKTPAMSRQLRESSSRIRSLADARQVIDSASQYTAKLPDEGLATRLDAINWEEEAILLFVGRLIVSKGLHSIIAALPEIFARYPHARLLVVGHGPFREAMELLVHAQATGNRSLAESIVQWGSGLEGNPPQPLATVTHYWNHLKSTDQWETYWQHAREFVQDERVIFTGYLTHNELRYLFPCADVAIFPSVVAEAGPLVFLEALASGCFPMGTYFAGMAASIDSVAAVLPDEVANLMKIRKEEAFTCRDIAEKAPIALETGPQYREVLRNVAVERYDWKQIAQRFYDQLLSMEHTQ